MTDPRARVTSYTYNPSGQVLSETNQLAATRNYEYDLIGNLKKATDRLGRTREWTRDNLYRPLQEVWKTGGTTNRTITSTFDMADQLTTITDVDSAYAYTYDQMGRVTNVSNGGTVGTPTVNLTRAPLRNNNVRPGLEELIRPAASRPGGWFIAAIRQVLSFRVFPTPGCPLVG